MPRSSSLALALLALLAPGLRAQDPGLEGLQAAYALAGAGLRAAAPAKAPPVPPGPCAASALGPPTVSSGKSGSAYWAEASVCLPFPAGKLWSASRDKGVMTWEGVTRIGGFSSPTPDGPIRVDYESRSRYLGLCHTARWPMAWSYALLEGDAGSPRAAEVTFKRVAGGDFNGGFISAWSGRVRLKAYSPDRTAVRMRYEISAPTQSPEKAAKAALAYLVRLARKASGLALPGPAENPDCRY